MSTIETDILSRLARIEEKLDRVAEKVITLEAERDQRRGWRVGLTWPALCALIGALSAWLLEAVR